MGELERKKSESARLVWRYVEGRLGARDEEGVARFVMSRMGVVEGGAMAM